MTFSAFATWRSKSQKQGYDFRAAVDGRDGVSVFEEEGPFEYVFKILGLKASSDRFPALSSWIYRCQSLTVRTRSPYFYLHVLIFRTGVGATQEIRRIEADTAKVSGDLQRVRIVALTGMSSLEDKRRAFEAGVDG